MNEMMNNYPKKSGRSMFMYRFRQVLRWLMLIAVISCPIVNYYTGKPYWSPVVLWSLFFLWKMFMAPDVLEMNSLGLVFRAGSYSLVLITLIGLLLSPGWIGFVLPIIGFSILILSAVFYLINKRRHRHDAMPLIWEVLVALIVVLIVYEVTGQLNWPMIVLGGVAAFIAVMGLLAFGKDIWHELVKRFHT